MSSVTSRLPKIHAAAGRPVDDALWDVRLFGAFRILDPDGADATPNGRKARALLAYLVLADGEIVPRDRLRALLWSERGDDQARASLRQTLYEMRALTSGDRAPVLLERSGVRVASRRVTSDRVRMRVAADAAAVSAAESPGATSLAALLGDRPSDLLIDLDGLDPAFDEWLRAERLRQSGDRRGLVLTAAERALGAHDAAGAYRLAQRMLACDPTDEAAARLAMAASHRAGDRDGVRRTFGQLRDALRAELATEPAAETVSLHRQLMIAEIPVSSRTKSGTTRAADDEPAPNPPAGVGQPPAASAQQTGGEVPIAHVFTPRRWMIAGVGTIALAMAVAGAMTLRPSASPTTTRTLSVMPLHAGTDDSAAQALRVGLSADLARMMVGNDGALRVVDGSKAPGTSSTSPSTFRIDGDAQSDAGVLHATIRLSHEQDGPIYWSKTFSRPVGEIEALREEMMSKLADVAICALGRTNPKAASFSVDALRLLLGACDLKQVPDYPETVKLLEQLVALRPDFAHGWALLAVFEQFVAMLTPGEAKTLRADAERSAQRALALDPNDADAYYARALGMERLARWSEQMDLLARGHALDPMNGRIDNAIGIDLEEVGRWREAVAFHQRAVKVDPFSTAKTAALIYSLGWGDDPSAANAVLAEARERFGHHRVIAYVDFTFNASIGDPRRAQSVLDDPARGFVFLPDRIELWTSLIADRIAPSAANEARADRAIRAAMGSPDVYLPLVIEMLARRSRVDEAFEVIDRLRPEEKGDLEPWILFTALTKPLRHDPRFMTVAARYGLVSIWKQTGHWPDFCDDPALPYACRVEAERAVSPNPRSLVATR